MVGVTAAPLIAPAILKAAPFYAPISFFSLHSLLCPCYLMFLTTFSLNYRQFATPFFSILSSFHYFLPFSNPFSLLLHPNPLSAAIPHSLLVPTANLYSFLLPRPFFSTTPIYSLLLPSIPHYPDLHIHQYSQLFPAPIYSLTPVIPYSHFFPTFL